MSSPTSWPEGLVGTPAVAVIERAIERRRLSHSLLLTANDLDTLTGSALAIADRLLNTPQSTARFNPEQHPDCFALRPAGKMRQISAEATRDLITKLQVSPAVSRRKVAIIYECDRMHIAAANVFLKTLEEPPSNSMLLLLTTRPYALLPTVRSRCLLFRFPVAAAQYSPDGWNAWLSDYRAWLERLCGGIADKRAAADSLFSAYGLVARFSMILDNAAGEVWAEQKTALPAELSDDEEVAIETGIANGLRTRLFAEIEHATLAFAQPRLQAGDELARRCVAGAVGKLEHVVGLLRLNLNEAAALEEFMLASLRLWTKR